MTQWPISATHAHLLPTGKVLIFGEFEQGSAPPLLWDPVTDSLTEVARADYNVFCAGHSFLPDGKLFIAGGHEESHVGFPYARIFDPWTLTWSSVPDMNGNRWYPSVTTLPTGDILVTSGEMHMAGENNPLAQVFQRATNTWRDLDNAIFELPYYPRQFVAPNGRVFIGGPSKGLRWLDTDGPGAWVNGGGNLCCIRSYGPALTRDGKVYLIGGGDPPTATVEVIDLNASEPVARYVAPMSIARRQHNATFLPDGRILVTGGSSAAGFNESSGSVEHAEVYDPETDTWTTWSSATGFYGYHSTALLVPDGRVLVAGGRTKRHQQVFSPPYLFAGPRPQVSSAPEQIAPASSFAITTPDAARIRKVSLIALASTTHAFDQNTRFVSLAFSATTGGLEVTAPANNFVAPPGPYQLFLVDDQGVPSVGKVVFIGTKARDSRRILKFSDTWKYDDSDVDHGTAWIEPGFDDSGWSSGTGQFGYGDWDNATTLTKRTPTQPSYYFRKTFRLLAPLTRAELEVLHDDGAAVWINGQQVFSAGMGNGVDHAVSADISVNNKLSRQLIDLSQNPFRIGDNTIAVMVKQVGPTSNDVSFALQLDVQEGTAPEDGLFLNAPNGGEVFVTGESTVIRWETAGTSRPTVDLAWSADDGATWEPIATSVPNTGEYTWTVPSASTTLARVRVRSDIAPAMEDTSDGAFTITRAERRLAVPFGSIWRYDDSGLDPGSDWNLATFDDSTWKSGAGQLGYGERDEATKLTRTSPSQTSVYFRHTVHVNGAVSAALLDVLFDDGIAVWVNGTLAFSRNVDRGLDHSVYASVSTDNERDSASIPSSLFVQGENVIAVMVKQNGRNSPDLSFDLALTLDVEASSQSLTVLWPNGGETLMVGGTYDITWSGTPLGSNVDIAFRCHHTGDHWIPIAQSAPNTGQFTWTVPDEQTTHGLIRVTISGDPTRTDESDGSFTVIAANELNAISFGDVWKYEDSGLDPGATWTSATFDDSGWSSGAGQLGYGDGDETTVLTRTDPSQTSVYFRKLINVEGTVGQADLQAIFDDGIAVYVNGVLVVTQNMDRGTEHGRYATASAENSLLSTSLPLTENPFVQGTNVIAVMVKQTGASSPDLSFDLELKLRVTP